MEWFSFAAYGNLSDYGWCSFYDFFREIGILKNENFDKFVELLDSGIYDMIQFDKVCIVVEMTEICEKDENNNLHSLTGMALKFGDEYGIYSINGVEFDHDLWDKIANKKFANASEILSIDNQQQKQIAIKYYGYENILKEVEHKVIDERTVVGEPSSWYKNKYKNILLPKPKS